MSEESGGATRRCDYGRPPVWWSDKSPCQNPATEHLSEYDLHLCEFHADQLTDSDTDDEYGTDRPRGIFTAADRVYLDGKRGLSKRTEYNTCRRIRERYKNAIKDIHVLAEGWDDLRQRDKRQIAAVDTSVAIMHLAEIGRGDATLDTELGDLINRLESAVETLEGDDE